MSTAFDPYHEWLSIPPEEQPPDHYRLLGLKRFEAKPGVIENAADRQMAHLRHCQSGGRAEHSQKLLDEVSAAKVVLLNEEKKTAYDAALKAELARKKKPTEPPLPKVNELLEAPPAPAAHSPTPTPEVPSNSPGTTRNGHRVSPALLYGGIAAAGMFVLAAAVGYSLFAGGFFAQPLVAENQVASQPAGHSHAITATIPATTGGDKEPETGDSSRPDLTGVKLGTGSKDISPDTPPNDGDAAETFPHINNPSPKPNPSKPRLVSFNQPETSPPDAGSSAVSPPDVAAAEPKKFPVPAKADRNAKRKEIESIFPIADAETFEEKGALAAQLIGTGRQSNNDLVAQFALFNLAREIASESGQIKLAFEAIDELSATFEFDPDAVRVASIDAAIRANLPPAAKREIFTVGAPMLDEFLAEDRYPEATALLDRLLGVARSLRDTKLLKQIAEQRRTVDELATEFNQVQADFATLQTDPESPEANLVAGRYLTFVKQDWEKGMPHLAKGSDAALATAARADLAQPQTTHDEVNAGDAWWDAAAGEEDSELGKLCRARAGFWYRKAIDQLAGLNKAKAEQRIKEAGEFVAAGPPKLGAFSHNPAELRPPSTRANIVYLDDAQETEAKVGWGGFHKHGIGVDGDRNKRVTFEGKELTHSLAMHAVEGGAAYAIYDVNGRFKSFAATAALPDDCGGEAGSQSPLTFRVLGDGKILWESKPIKRKGTGEDCQVNIDGVRKLRLEISCPGGYRGSWSMWINPRVSTADVVPKDAVEEEASPRRQ